MTARRQRRQRAREETIPEAICAWFSGEPGIPWEALLPGDYERVPEWWAAWCAAYPGATPPADAITGQFPGAS